MNKAAKEALDVIDLYVRDLERQVAELKHSNELLIEQRDEDYDTLVKAVTTLAGDDNSHWINIFHQHWDLDPRVSFNKVVESFKKRNLALMQGGTSGTPNPRK